MRLDKTITSSTGATLPTDIDQDVLGRWVAVYAKEPAQHFRSLEALCEAHGLPELEAIYIRRGA